MDSFLNHYHISNAAKQLNRSKQYVLDFMNLQLQKKITKYRAKLGCEILLL